MRALEFRLLNEFQRRFPLVSQPFAVLAETLGAAEHEVIATLARLHSEGAISRIGAVFRPGAVGASTLAAMAVPPERLEAVAMLVSRFPEVNHNYEREHGFNLWFVASAQDDVALEAVLDRVERVTGVEAMRLPLLEEYHIDLGFPLDRREARAAAAPRRPERVPLDAAGGRLIGALEDGLELVVRPFAALAARTGLGETEVIDRLASWQAGGVIRRFGVVVRHHELGYRANAMAVWDVPDRAAPGFGRALAAADGVTLAYRRARAYPAWPYNLYCMVHGLDRHQVVARLAEIDRGTGLHRFPHEVLFSRTRFKQTGPRYASAEGALAAPSPWKGERWSGGFGTEAPHG
jgi:DNA-binding Lrp family transcriptional regulator